MSILAKNAAHASERSGLDGGAGCPATKPTTGCAVSTPTGRTSGTDGARRTDAGTLKSPEAAHTLTSTNSRIGTLSSRGTKRAHDLRNLAEEVQMVPASKLFGNRH